MNTYDVLFFDLDGTLTDPGEGITNAVTHALARFGIPVEDRRTLYPFIGPPLADSFRDFYGFDPEQCRTAVKVYREYYGDRGLFENRVYDGIPEALDALRSDGLRLAVATSKPEHFARRILERFGLADRFAYIAGAAMNETRLRKAEVIRYALETMGLRDPARVLMVGDRKHDVLGARECGMDCLGVLYGYGDRQELEAAGAKWIVPTVAELPGAIRSIR